MRVLHICPGYFDAPLYDKLFKALQTIEVVNEIFIFHGTIGYSYFIA